MLFVTRLSDTQAWEEITTLEALGLPIPVMSRAKLQATPATEDAFCKSVFLTDGRVGKLYAPNLSL